MIKDPGSRIGFQATPFLQFGQTISSKTMKKGQILTSLKRANLSGTSVDSKALELLLSHCKNIQKMIMDDEIWNHFFNLFEIDDDRGGITVGCIGELYECFDRKRALVKYQSHSGVIKVML